MPRLSLAVLSLAVLLPACSQPRAVTDEANGRATVPDPPHLVAPTLAGSDADPILVRPVLIMPGAYFPPSNWMHIDLAGYLELKGVKVEVRSGESFNQPDRQAVIFRSGSDTDDTTAAVLVYRCKDVRTARAVAATMGQNAYSRGLFAFGPLSATTRTTNLLREIGKALLPPLFD
ncbi:hypothetical protein [Frigoriglobus tundricola]|uniref:Uncharacterized protein n=1 Tax=Frigoriglobus tundricola TaxID=2774151 RepID=A0A6M5Z376_9BACT|nr:hypothetical protein [Frigoriglobus tundricola]QJX00165.1 hypothetical protein FTUN_7789 [Frigoriglobus tundricola]